MRVTAVTMCVNNRRAIKYKKWHLFLDQTLSWKQQLTTVSDMNGLPWTMYSTINNSEIAKKKPCRGIQNTRSILTPLTAGVNDSHMISKVWSPTTSKQTASYLFTALCDSLNQAAICCSSVPHHRIFPGLGAMAPLAPVYATGIFQNVSKPYCPSEVRYEVSP